jgi:hypothetical protein
VPGLVVAQFGDDHFDVGDQVDVVLFEDEVFEVIGPDGDGQRIGRAAEFDLLPVLFFMTVRFAAMFVATLLYLVARVRALGWRNLRPDEPTVPTRRWVRLMVPGQRPSANDAVRE